MRYHVLATDYDGTLAHEGAVAPEVLAALARARASGRKLLLVTGREVDDLLRVFPEVAAFDLVVAENGAVVYNPSTRQTRTLAEAPPAAFVELLRQRGVGPISVGHVIVATWQPHETVVLEVIRTMGLELQVIFNKGAVMILPSGINKAVGLQSALDELGLSAHNTIAVGDAENDHAFLAVSECAVAVANALPSLKERADLVTVGQRGDGVRELCDALVDSDLAALAPRLVRHQLPIGRGSDGQPLQISAYGPPFLIAGSSGGGKSTLATSFLEALAERGYQFCVIDPEGDHAGLPQATMLGTTEQPPSIDELIDVLANPKQNVVANLTGISVGDRPTFFHGLLPRLLELRGRTGRPHWIIVDEAHHLLPHDWRPAATTMPQQPHNLVFITVHPEHVSPTVLATVDLAIAIGRAPADTLKEFARAVGVGLPPIDNADLPTGQALAWWRSSSGALLRLLVDQPRAERRRHIRKYATGELEPSKSFYFRGPDDRLKLRAQNLQMFLQVGDGVDDDTWLHHLRQGDYSAWFREAIKDDGLADEAALVESGEGDAAQSRARIRAAIESRYTAPA